MGCNSFPTQHIAVRKVNGWDPALQVNREAGKAAVVTKDILGMLAHLNVHEDF